MSSPTPLSRFYSARLIHVLADLALVNADEPGNALAEKWGEWLDVSAAIELSAALRPMSPMPPASPVAPASPMASASVTALAAHREVLLAVQARLTATICNACALEGRGRLVLPAEATSDYTPFRRVFCALQREMELDIGPLRARVRAALAQSAVPALRELAALDQTLENSLAVRENRLLAVVPLLLEKQFTHLHQQSLQDAAAPADWLAPLRRLLQAALLAELELRLLPVNGLIDAIDALTHEDSTA